MKKYLSIFAGFSLMVLVATAIHANQPINQAEISGETAIVTETTEPITDEQQLETTDTNTSHQELTEEHADTAHHAPAGAPVPSWFKYVTAALFALAIIHTFLVSKFTSLAHKYPEGSIPENLFHLLGEVEAVFLIWTGVLVSIMTLSTQDWHTSVDFINSLNFTEPMFVFVIMIIAATRPIIDLADWFIRQVDRVFPLQGSAGFLATILIVGPILGSFITEPAAMTVSALILYRGFFSRKLPLKIKYAILAGLFVNVSIGGSLTNFAAPPVIMVAGPWGWDLAHMFMTFGWKAVIAIIINSYAIAIFFKKDLNQLPLLKDSDARGKDAADIKRIPFWVSAVHIFFLAFTVLNAHYTAVFMGGFIFFLGFVTVTKEYQEALKLKEALLVAGFLAGLIALGSLQKWWIQPVISSLAPLPLFFGTTALTAITDNAALTFLASQVENLSEMKKYLVVAGALAGGGLTVIANAPNPAGYSIVNKAFGPDGVNPGKLFMAALGPTAVAVIAFLVPALIWGVN